MSLLLSLKKIHEFDYTGIIITNKEGVILGITTEIIKMFNITK